MFFFFTKRKVRWVFKVTALLDLVTEPPWDGDLLQMHHAFSGVDMGTTSLKQQVVETAQLLKENHERGDPISIGFCQK